MKVLQYNVLDGWDTRDRFSAFETWFMQRPYDVAGFNELNGWDADRFKSAGLKWGYPHACLFEMKTSPYFVGVLSKTPIKPVRFDETNFYHGLLHVIIQDVHFLIAHLTPFESSFREKEAERIAQLVTEIDGPAMVMGDLNSLSPFDHRHYSDIRLVEHLETTRNGPIQHLKQGVINYRPMHILHAAGLHDIGLGSEFTPTIPTSLKHPPHIPKRRIDYMLVNERLLQRSPKATVIHHEQVERLSDHYPVECYWQSADL